VGMYWWQGRQLTWLNPRNVEVKNGQLHLTMRQEPLAEMKAKAIMIIARCPPYESALRLRLLRSQSPPLIRWLSFWFQQEDPAFLGWATEVDVFGCAASHPCTIGAIT
jgi:hypothetical protein